MIKVLEVAKTGLEAQRLALEKISRNIAFLKCDENGCVDTNPLNNPPFKFLSSDAEQKEEVFTTIYKNKIYFYIALSKQFFYCDWKDFLTQEQEENCLANKTCVQEFNEPIVLDYIYSHIRNLAYYSPSYAKELYDNSKYVYMSDAIYYSMKEVLNIASEIRPKTYPDEKFVPHLGIILKEENFLTIDSNEDISRKNEKIEDLIFKVQNILKQKLPRKDEAIEEYPLKLFNEQQESIIYDELVKDLNGMKFHAIEYSKLYFNCKWDNFLSEEQIRVCEEENTCAWHFNAKTISNHINGCYEVFSTSHLTDEGTLDL